LLVIRLTAPLPEHNWQKTETKMRKMIWLLASALVLSTGWIPTAQTHSHEHKGNGAQHSHGPKGHGSHGRASPDTPAVREYKAAHAKMMRDMDIVFTGNPDVDFRRHMIPHHQGAIDMARVALRHAKDPWTRQFAEAIIIEQQREIAEMQAWLARHGATVPPGGQPQHIIGANSYPSVRLPEEPGSQGELRGQSWAPKSVAPAQ
jgi:hypothetical protein